MKAIFSGGSSRVRLGWLGVLWLAWSALCAVSLAEEARIVEVRVEGVEVVVKVDLPAGMRRVTLESRERFGAGTWEPRAVLRVGAEAGVVTFRLPASRTLELLRVRGDVTEPLPEHFYTGNAVFGAQPGGSTSWRYFDGWMANPGSAEDAGAREVVESDIWKRLGDTLYVFNAYRGLQVIDLSDPDQPLLRGALAVPAAGRAMYLLGDHHAVLLADGACGWGADGPRSRVLVVAVGEAPPKVVATLELAGMLRESRMVGDVLYVAAETYRATKDNVWEWGTQISSHRLTYPAAPESMSGPWFAGYGLAVSATPEFFFVATPQSAAPQRSVVHCLDITDPAGSVREHAALELRGRVADKFKMDWSQGVLRVASEASPSDAGGGVWKTWLETFRLPDPQSAGPLPVAKLGELDLGLGERLFATRFDGARAYLVTYRVVDPLWVVDLADPARPRIAGELHVPGWSTYIQPLGERLVAMGIDDTDGRRAAVSLFDVADPARPGLLARVSLGEGYSWSDANQDEKAFTVLADERLILVPYTGLSAGSYGSRVQLIDLDLESGGLVVRGEIEHQFGARRTMVHRARMVAISDRELLSVDIGDRDRPVVTALLPLAWPVDEVLLYGDWVLQISRGNVWEGGAGVRVAQASDPAGVVAAAQLERDWPVLGAGVRGDRLVLAQGLTNGDVASPVDPEDPESGAASNFRLTLFDLTRLPGELPVVGSLEAGVEPLGWGGAFQLLWPREDVLVVAGGGGGAYPYWGGWDAPWLGRPAYWGGTSAGGNRFMAVDLGEPTTPALLSDLTLDATEAFDFSPAFQVGECVYLSHSQAIRSGPIPVIDPATGDAKLLDRPDWLGACGNHYLDVIDYADPTTPVVRGPVAVPGRLEGVGRGGALLYTVGPHWEPAPDGSYDGTEWLDALAYDGVAAHWVDAIRLPTEWPRVLEIARDYIYLGRATDPSSSAVSQELEIWHLSDQGKFSLGHRLPLAWPVYSAKVLGDLMVGTGDGSVVVLDLADPAAPSEWGTARPEGCMWLDAERAVGSRAAGVWFPLGLSGVWSAGVGPQYGDARLATGSPVAR